jgi:tetratricopeptide (TPR) repeat protein
LEKDVEAGLRLITSIGRFWYLRGRTREHCDWITRLLDRPEAQAYPLASALGRKSADLAELGDFAQAQSCTDLSLSLSREIGDRQVDAFSLYILAWIQADVFSARRLCEQSLALYRLLGDKAGQARVLHELAFRHQEDDKRSQAFAEESLALYREAGDQIGIATELGGQASLFTLFGNYGTARQLIEEALPMQRKLVLKNEIPYSLTVYGRLAFWQGNLQQACAYLEESIALFDEIGHLYRGFWARAFLAYVFLRQGELSLARLGFMDGLKRSQKVGGTIGTVFVLEGLASLAEGENRPERAALLFAWADEMRRTNDNPRPENEQASVDCDLAAIRAQLDEASLQTAEAAGRAMTLEQAMANALEKMTI